MDICFFEGGWETQFNPLQVQPFRWLCSGYSHTWTQPGSQEILHECTLQSGPATNSILGQAGQQFGDLGLLCQAAVSGAGFQPLAMSEWYCPYPTGSGAMGFTDRPTHLEALTVAEQGQRCSDTGPGTGRWDKDGLGSWGSYGVSSAFKGKGI